MIGTVIHFNGTFGLVYAENGEKYTLHRDNIQDYKKVKQQFVKIDPEHPLGISFEIGKPLATGLRLQALNATVLDTAPVIPNHADHGIWHRRKTLSGFQCSSCAGLSPTEYPFCPWCGITMTKKEKE